MKYLFKDTIFLASVIIMMISYNSHAQDDQKAKAEQHLKTFLKVEEGTRGWFNSYVKSLYSEGKTTAARGQVKFYLWSSDQFVAFHFFTYGGGSNIHYIASVNSNGETITLEKILTQNLKLENYFNVEKYGEDMVLTTEETQEMNTKNPGRKPEERVYVNAYVYGIDEQGKLIKKRI